MSLKIRLRPLIPSLFLEEALLRPSLDEGYDRLHPPVLAAEEVGGVVGAGELDPGLVDVLGYAGEKGSLIDLRAVGIESSCYDEGGVLDLSGREEVELVELGPVSLDGVDGESDGGEVHGGGVIDGAGEGEVLESCGHGVLGSGVGRVEGREHRGPLVRQCRVVDAGVQHQPVHVVGIGLGVQLGNESALGPADYGDLGDGVDGFEVGDYGGDVGDAFGGGHVAGGVGRSGAEAWRVGG